MVKVWSSSYPTGTDSTSNMANLINLTDETDVSHVMATRDSVIGLEAQVGDDTIASGTLRYRVGTLETTMGNGSTPGSVVYRLTTMSGTEVALSTVATPEVLAGTGKLYTKEVLGEAELFYRNNTYPDVQITSVGETVASGSAGLNITFSGTGDITATTLNFTGPDVDITDGGGGVVDVTVSGSATAPAAPTGGASSLWVPPLSPHAEDDEFDSDTLDAAWQEEYSASVSSIDPYAGFTTGDPRISLNSYRSSWYMIQPKGDGTNYFMTKVITIPTNCFIWTRICWTQRWNSVVNNDPLVLWGFWATTAGGADTDNRVSLMQNTEAGQLNFQSYTRESASTLGYVITSNFYNFGTVFEYMGIQKLGNDFHYWVFSDSGQRMLINSTTSYAGSTLDRVGWAWLNASSNTPGNCIIGTDFFRMVDSAVFLP